MEGVIIIMRKNSNGEVIKTFKAYDLTMIGEFVDVRTKVLCKTKEGYLHYATIDNLKHGFKPNPFHSCNPYVLHNIKKWIKENNINLKLLSDSYKSIYSRLEFITNEGFLVSTSWDNLKRGKDPSPFHPLNIQTISNIKTWCKKNEKNFELISEEYTSSKHNMKWKCLKNECEEIFYATWCHILQDKGCPYCSGKRSGVSNCLATINPKLAEEWNYKKNNGLTPFDVTPGSSKKVWWICGKCNREYQSVIYSRVYGNNCEKCGILSRSKENHPDWKGGISSLSEYLRHKMTEWKKQSILNSNNKCIITHDKFDTVHHLRSFDLILQETLDICVLPFQTEINKYTIDELRLLENTCKLLHKKYGLGVSLKKEIHDLFHKRYGRKENTKEQFKEFALEYGVLIQ